MLQQPEAQGTREEPGVSSLPGAKQSCGLHAAPYPWLRAYEDCGAFLKPWIQASGVGVWPAGDLPLTFSLQWGVLFWHWTDPTCALHVHLYAAILSFHALEGLLYSVASVQCSPLDTVLDMCLPTCHFGSSLWRRKVLGTLARHLDVC